MRRPPEAIELRASVSSDDDRHGHARLSIDSFHDGDDDDEDGDDADAEAAAMHCLSDAPLLYPTPSTQPFWLTHRTRRLLPYRLPSRLSSSLRSRLPAILRLVRPRLTWRYVLLSTALIYSSYCLLTGSHLLASRLPDYTGPHRVGALDLEVPLAEPLVVSNATLRGTDSDPAFELETVLFTLYYPVGHDARSSRPRHLWFPRPVSLTAEGYATLAHANNFVVRPLFTFFLWFVGGSITIPAAVDVPLLPASSSDDNPLPVMVFSHGMASSRTDYTHYLGELASHGHVVAAIEHRDGSCPGTIINAPSKPPRRLLPLRLSDLVSDPPMDEPRLKRDQLAFRTAEIMHTIAALRTLHAAGSDLATTRDEGDHLDSFTGRLDFSLLTIGGHSYGATGVLQALKDANSTSNPAIGGIALDPGKSSGPLNSDIPVPLLVVHSNSWSRSHSIFYGRPHFDTVRDLVRDVLNRTGAAWFLTSKGTSHPSVTDAPLLEPLMLSWTTGASLDVRHGLREYVRVSRDFLHYLHRNNFTGLLAQRTTHDEYDKWVSPERQDQFPQHAAKDWQVHVSAADISDNDDDDDDNNNNNNTSDEDTFA